MEINTAIWNPCISLPCILLSVIIPATTLGWHRVSFYSTSGHHKSPCVSECRVEKDASQGLVQEIQDWLPRQLTGAWKQQGLGAWRRSSGDTSVPIVRWLPSSLSHCCTRPFFPDHCLFLHLVTNLPTLPEGPSCHCSLSATPSSSQHLPSLLPSTRSFLPAASSFLLFPSFLSSLFLCVYLSVCVFKYVCSHVQVQVCVGTYVFTWGGQRTILGIKVQALAIKTKQKPNKKKNTSFYL